MFVPLGYSLELMEGTLMFVSGHPGVSLQLYYLTRAGSPSAVLWALGLVEASSAFVHQVTPVSASSHWESFACYPGRARSGVRWGLCSLCHLLGHSRFLYWGQPHYHTPSQHPASFPACAKQHETKEKLRTTIVGLRHWSGSQEAMVQFLAVPQIRCVTLGKSPDQPIPLLAAEWGGEPLAPVHGVQ